MSVQAVLTDETHWRAEDYSWDPHNLEAVHHITDKNPEIETPCAKKDQYTKPANDDDSENHDISPSFNYTATTSLTEKQSPQQVSQDDATSKCESPSNVPAVSSKRKSCEVTSDARDENAGVSNCSESSPVPVLKENAFLSRGNSKKKIPLQCQVDGCQKDLSKEKEYYQRYRICEMHLKLSSLIKDGMEQRFCQQCGRFHVLADFDSDKRSCRARLNLHNNRRRKRLPNGDSPPQRRLRSCHRAESFQPIKSEEDKSKSIESIKRDSVVIKELRKDPRTLPIPIHANSSMIGLPHDTLRNQPSPIPPVANRGSKEQASINDTFLYNQNMYPNQGCLGYLPPEPYLGIESGEANVQTSTQYFPQLLDETQQIKSHNRALNLSPNLTFGPQHGVSPSISMLKKIQPKADNIGCSWDDIGDGLAPLIVTPDEPRKDNNVQSANYFSPMEPLPYQVPLNVYREPLQMNKKFCSYPFPPLDLCQQDYFDLSSIDYGVQSQNGKINDLLGNNFYDQTYWLTQYAHFHGDLQQSSEIDRLRLKRSSLKMDLNPDSLPMDLRSSLLYMTNSPETGHMETVLRPGCCHLITSTLTRETMDQSDSFMLAKKLHDSCPKFWRQVNYSVQCEDSITIVGKGHIAKHVPAKAAELKGALPPQPLLEVYATVPNKLIELNLVKHNTLALENKEGRKNVNLLKILARCNGCVLHDAQIDVSEDHFKIPMTDMEGAIWVETEINGILSRASLLVLSQDQDVVDEINSFKNRLTGVLSEQSMNSLLADIGVCLQYARHIENLQQELQSEIAKEPTSIRIAPNTCAILNRAAVTQFDEGQMSGKVFLSYIAQVSVQVLSLCIREGWPALASKLFPIASIGKNSFAELVEKIEEILGDKLLLYSAVSSGSISMITVLLNLFDKSRFPYDVTGSFEGVTALHLAAGMSESVISELLMDRLPTAKMYWNSLRNLKGRSPADIAYMSKRLSVSAPPETIAMLCKKTEALNSPPPTPRVPKSSAKEQLSMLSRRNNNSIEK